MSWTAGWSSHADCCKRRFAEKLSPSPGSGGSGPVGERKSLRVLKPLDAQVNVQLRPAQVILVEKLNVQNIADLRLGTTDILVGQEILLVANKKQQSELAYVTLPLRSGSCRHTRISPRLSSFPDATARMPGMRKVIVSPVCIFADIALSSLWLRSSISIGGTDGEIILAGIVRLGAAPRSHGASPATRSSGWCTRARRPGCTRRAAEANELSRSIYKPGTARGTRTARLCGQGLQAGIQPHGARIRSDTACAPRASSAFCSTRRPERLRRRVSPS